MADHEETIRALAYVLWEEAGRPDGRSEEFWHAAVERLATTPKKPAKAAKPKAKDTPAPQGKPQPKTGAGGKAASKGKKSKPA